MRYILVENSNSPHEEGLVAILNVLRLHVCDVTVFLGASHVERARALGIHALANRVFTLSRWFGWWQLVRYRRRDDRTLYNTTSVRTTPFVFVTSFGRGMNIYYIRNANAWLRYSAHFTEWRDFLPRWISTAMKKFLLSRAHFVVVEFESIRRYLQSHLPVRVDVIPFKNYTGEGAHRDSGYVHLIVPGAVDFRTKDIATLVNAMLLLPSAARDRIKLTLLGRTASSMEEQQCREWKKRLGSAFQYYSSFVSVAEFSEAFETADAVVCCFVLEHRCAYYRETYGTSRGSGVVAHAFARGLPLIVNDGFVVDAQYARATHPFRSVQELSAIFASMTDQPEVLREWQGVAATEGANYSLRNVTNQLHYLTEDV